MEYKDSGVDRDAAANFVENLKSKVRKTAREEVLGELGDFGAFFEAPKKLKDPVWVATTDGVGTKLLLAEELGGAFHRAVGQDVVAMCVNDLIACRAEPIVFLDYLATGKLEEKLVAELLTGIVDACKESNCTLAGGETAQMPGFYQPGRYDVAGFSVGVLERSNRMKLSDTQPGDLIFGLESNGFHSNGFSLIRKILDQQKWKLSDRWESASLGEILLRPTRLYVRPLLEIFSRVRVNAAAHITGGGIVENLPRGVDESKVQLIIQKNKIPTFSFMRKFVEAGRLSEREAFSTWNMGIGFCIIVPPTSRTTLQSFKDLGLHEIGHVEKKSDSKAETVILE